MRAEIEKTLEKSKSKTSRLLGNLSHKLRRNSLVPFSASNNTLSTLELNQIQTHRNIKACVEIERQQSNGLMYSNIVRFR